ncbi:AAA family ATPase [Haloprofundus salinisoli]|uniref:AAA family ATPase n=1 Tax=Haloprofundus salinisoli TaxID=2876193 RepID=UPI001CCFBBA7|nr:AAA family ATPase [Haloprofundus salinisoli]
MSLEIHEIRIKNYRQYAGEQAIDLSCPEHSRINILEGQNGAGKSNLLNAVTLCFYGKEEHNGDSEEEQLPYVSQPKLSELEPGESASGFVEITLGYDNPKYRFRRDFETYKRDDGGFEDVRDDLTLQRYDNRNWVTENNPNTYLTQILPGNVSDYFLFDGEDLEGFFSEGYPTDVKDAILDVSHTQLLNRSVDHLKKTKSDLQNDAEDAEGEVGELQDEIEALEAEIEETKEEKSLKERDLEETEQNIRNVRNKMADISNEEVRRRYKERDDLREDIEAKEKRVLRLQKEVTELMLEAGPTVYAHRALHYAKEEFSEKESKGELPPKIRRWFIDELIEEGECMCGQPLDPEWAESEEERNEIEAHRQRLQNLRDEIPEATEEGMEGKTRIPSIIDAAKDKVKQIRSRRQLIAELEDEIDSDQQRVKDISSELQAYELPDDDVDVGSLEDQLERLEDTRDNLNGEIAILENEIAEIESELEQKDKGLKRELDKHDRYRGLVAQIEFTEEAVDELEHIKADILAEIRQETEENLEDYFNTLIWKNEEYDLVLNDDYSIEVLDPHGDNKIGSLSAGETQVLALSFMAALSQISGFDAPVIIDTPLGRISSEPRKRIAENLPQYLDNTQITFLMTDEEYTDSVRSLLISSVANEYLLNYKNQTTEVIPRE